MALEDLVTPQRVLPNLRANSKKQVLQELAQRAGQEEGLDEREIFETLLERERLGTTGVGQGIAIPHGKIEQLDKPYGYFAKLDTPVDFEAVDDQPVDLVFLLLAPKDGGAEHLKALARVSRLLRNQSVTEKLRHSDTAAAIYALLTEQATSHAA